MLRCMLLLLMPLSIEGLGITKNRLRGVQDHAATRTQRWRTTVPRMVAQSRRQRWETARSGIAAPLLNTTVPQHTTELTLRYAALHRREYGLLRLIQRAPGLMPVSLAVHYSLLPKVITPLLALIVWFASLPKGASLITFVCANDCLNTAVKWAVQRPRPRWYSADAGQYLVSRCGAWEVDLSFPSAHTQFWAGMAFCVTALCGWQFRTAASIGFLIGLTRNYLSMHWPTDTLAGLALGGALGWTWGLLDPYGRLLAAGSPLLSLATATGFTAGLFSLMIAARKMTKRQATAGASGG